MVKLIEDFKNTMNPPVFFGATALILAFVIFGAVFTEAAGGVFVFLQDFIVEKFGWFYVLSSSVMLIFVIWLAFSRYGHIRLGGDDAVPEFRYLTWFTMLMAAGMGIGLVFFGVAEPVLHYLQPLEAESGSQAAIHEAMFNSFFHWGFHPWAIYIAFALPVAYFHFRYHLPLAPRTLLYPLVGERIHGPIGHIVDIISTVATLFGVGTSLGLGAMQINGGLNQIAGVPVSLSLQVLIIAVVTASATISVVTGLHIGIRRLSEFSVGLAGLILLFVLITGPTVYLLETFTSSIGNYFQNIISMSFFIDQVEHGQWQAVWTLFYWSWWIAWSPFVGIFAARISKGRTIRQFIGTMLFVPSLIGFFWFAVMGGTALFIEHYGPGGIAEPTLVDEALSFYAMLEHLPWTGLLWGLGTVLIVVFFVTSSDSGSLVDVMVTSGGHPNPPTAYRIYWCVAEGVVASVLLVSGGLLALRTASLTPALPMTVILLIACYGMVKALRVDIKTKGPARRKSLHQ
jgi:choline/glycine/proline betaine transport protein